MASIRTLAFSCLACAFQASDISEESVSLLQTSASKKKIQGGPDMKELSLGPPWVEVDANAFKGMVSEGMGMLTRTALELDLHEKEAQGQLPEGLRFPSAGKHEEQDVDLVITGDKKYNSGKLNEKKGEVNGLYRGFARIFVKGGSTQQLKIKVVKAGTDEVVKVPLLAVSFFSLGFTGKDKWTTSVTDCNEELVSEYWKGPSVTQVNETEAGCGGVSLEGAQKLLPRGRSDPKTAAEVEDDHCPGSAVLKWFDASEITLELTAGKPSNRKPIPFIFKVGLTKCDMGWEPPVVESKAEKKAREKAEKEAAKAAEKAEKEAAKAAEKAAKEAAKAAAKAAKKAR